MTNCKYKLRKLSVGLVSVGTMFMATTVYGSETAPAAPAPAVAAASTASNGGSDGQAQQQPQQLQEQTQSTVVQVQATVSGRSLAVRKEENNTETFETRVPSRQGLPEKNQSNGQNVEIGEDSYTVDIDTTTVEGRISETTVKDDKKLIRNRENSATELFDVKREVKVNEDGKTFDVTVTVTPKEIDKGAEVIVLLDTSDKMTESQLKEAKEGIKTLVTTLTGDQNNNEEKNRNSIKLITFDNTVDATVDLTKENVEEKLNNIQKRWYDFYSYGVNLQGAIHAAREELKKSTTPPGKHQHIVLFSQGEATFSYGLNESAKDKSTRRIGESVTYTNPYLPWPFNYSSKTKNANIIGDVQKMVEWAKNLGLSNKLETVQTALTVASKANNLISLFVTSPTEYLTLKEYKSENYFETDFDYSRLVGEGYHNYSFDKRSTSDMPLKYYLDTLLETAIKPAEKGWFGTILSKLSLTDTYTKASKSAIMKVLDYLFYKREDIYYNHNLSAQAEAEMAKKEGITFFSFDLNNKDKKSNSNKFEKYLKAMSEGGKDLLKENDVKNQDKFKHMITEVTITDTFDKGVSVKDNSWKTSLDGEKGTVSAREVKHNPANGGWWHQTKENLTWKISKDEFQKALKKGEKLTLTYKLEWKKDNGKEAKAKKAEKSELPKTTSESGTISNQISYKVNGKQGNGSSKLSHVTVTHTKKVVEDVETVAKIQKEREDALKHYEEAQRLEKTRKYNHQPWYVHLKDSICNKWNTFTGLFKRK